MINLKNIVGKLNHKQTRRTVYHQSGNNRDNPIEELVEDLLNEVNETIFIEEPINIAQPQPNIMEEDYSKILKCVQHIPIFAGGRGKKGIEELKLFTRTAEDLYNATTSPEQKTVFLRLITHRLRGDAFSVANSFKYDSLKDLIINLKKQFVPIKSPTDVVGEIGNAKQLPNESIRDFGAKLQELVTTAKELYSCKYPDKDTSLLETEAENQAIKSFKKGMSNSSIRTSLLTDKSISLRELVDTAATLEESYSEPKTSMILSAVSVKQYDALNIEMQELKDKLARLEVRENPVMSTQAVHNFSRNDPIVCGFCNNVGHTRQQCRKLYNTFCTNCNNYGHPIYECNIDYTKNNYHNRLSPNNRAPMRNNNNFSKRNYRQMENIQPIYNQHENYDSNFRKTHNQPNNNNNQYTSNSEPL